MGVSSKWVGQVKLQIGEEYFVVLIILKYGSFFDTTVIDVIVTIIDVSFESIFGWHSLIYLGETPLSML